MVLRILEMIAISGLSDSFRLHQTRFQPGLCPEPTGGAYIAFPDPLAGLRGPTFKGRGWDGRESGKGREGERNRGIAPHLSQILGFALLAANGKNELSHLLTYFCIVFCRMSLSTVLITWRKVFMRLASTLWQSLMANPVLWSAIWTPTAERGLYVLRLHPTMPPIHRRIYTKIIGVCDGLCLRQRPTDFLAKANVCKLVHANRQWDSVWLDLRKRADPWKI